MKKKISTWFKRKFFPKAVGFGFNLVSLYSKKKSGMMLLKVISKPRGGEIKSYQKKFLGSCDKKEVIVYEDMNIQTYHWKGAGPKILLCHGWESNSWRWRKLLKSFSDTDYYFIAMDAPAHGATGSKEATGVIYGGMIHEVSKAYDIETIIGHSFGGFGAL